MRYDRVQRILEAEPAFKDRLGPKDQEVAKRNGQPQRFAKSVIEVTRRLHANGIDAHTAGKHIVLRLADDVLSAIKPAGSVVKKAPETKTEPKPAKVKTAKPAKEAEKTAARKQPKNEPARPAAASAPAAEPAPAAQPPAPAEPVTTTYIFLSVLTLLHSAYNLLQTFDREPGAEKRQEKLADQMEEVYRLRDVPVPVPVNIPLTLKNGQLSAAKG